MRYYAAANFWTPLTFTTTFYLMRTKLLITDTLLQQVKTFNDKRVAVDSYHSHQLIADRLLISEFSYFTDNDTTRHFFHDTMTVLCLQYLQYYSGKT